MSQLERHAYACETTVRVVPNLGMNDGLGRGQLGAQRMVIRDDPIHAQLSTGADFLHAAHAAIHRNKKIRIVGFLQFADAVQVQTVAI